MKKRILKSIVAILLFALMLNGCSKKTDSAGDALEGYWMDEQGNTITFVGDGSVIWYGLSYTYTIYDNDKVLIRNGDQQIGNYSFSVKSEMLELEDLKWNVTRTLFGNETKQEKILDALREAEKAQMEADAKAEQDFIEANIAAEREGELELLKTYKSQCTSCLGQSTIVDEKSFYESEIEAVQERIDILTKGNTGEINAHSFEMACDWVSRFVLSQETVDLDKMFFVDDGLHYIDNTNDGAAMIGYMIEARIDGGDVASMYGSYAVQFSTMSIYEYDVMDGSWEFITALNLVAN